MYGVNKVILIGNLGKDPEVRYLDGGGVVAKFSLATTETYKNKEGVKQEQTEWHNIVLWRGLAELAEKFLKKGMSVYIEGKIRSSSWEDKEGKKHYKTEIVGDTMNFLSRKSSSEGTPASAESSGTMEPAITQGAPEATDDLPF
jgi:single-strand DNA-binding protein